MPYREFVDLQNVRWRVWATVPTVGKVLSNGFENGWLTFEAGDQLCRLGPIPDGWEDFSDARLRALLKQAIPATRTPSRGRIATR